MPRIAFEIRALLVIATAMATATATALVPQGSATAANPPAVGAEAGEPKITVAGTEGDYLRAVHQLIHYRFANKFIDAIAAKQPATDPLNKPGLRTQIYFGLRWDGSVSDVVVDSKSGVPAFDQAAVAAIRGDSLSTRYSPPPAELFGDDGVAHFRWVFSRDHNLCGEGAVRRVEAPLAEALPSLFVQGRLKEALLRAGRDSRAGTSDGIGLFAQAWLERPQADPATDARAAAALLRYGDKRARTKAYARIKPALARRETAPIAGPALGAYAAGGASDLTPAGFCDLVGGAKALREGETAAREQAMVLLRDAGVTLPPESPCVKTLTELAGDGATPPRLRALALGALVATAGSAPGKVVRESMEDKDAGVRAAGATAFAKPGGGRPALYRLQPLLQDSSPEVRAAVAGALVRACGDLALPFVQPLFKERDDRALVAMAPELGRLKSPESADLLAKMMTRPGGELRLAVTRGLVDRKDDPGKALRAKAFDTIRRDAYASAELRGLVYADASADELMKQPKDPLLGPLGFKALLRAKRHPEAADWLLANFDRLSPETAVDLLGAWLANPPPPAPTTPPKRAG
ncbi:MAG TPA: HEAT repeat domain-containing protein [Polyangia bacterium]|nr:HEAT repeat domain-containing protein [Polyangia bacterium]